MLVNVCRNAAQKIRNRGLHQDFISIAVLNGQWFHDGLDSAIMHCLYHGHDVICRYKYNGLFVITVNTNVGPSFSQKLTPMQAPPDLASTSPKHQRNADSNPNWRENHVKQPDTEETERRRPVNEHAVLRITQEMMQRHRQERYTGVPILQSLTPVANITTQDTVVSTESTSAQTSAQTSETNVVTE